MLVQFRNSKRTINTHVKSVIWSTSHISAFISSVAHTLTTGSLELDLTLSVLQSASMLKQDTSVETRDTRHET